MKHIPLVSVIMSVYNGSCYLEEAVESILNQIFTDYEFIIINDGSSDSTKEILQRYARSDCRIRLIENESRQGMPKSLNRGLGSARGYYIARMDADDVAHSCRLEQQVTYLRRYSECSLVGTWYYEIREDGSLLREIRPPHADEDLRKSLISCNPFLHSSIMFSREISDHSGAYREQWTYGEDYEFYFRVVRKFRVANIPLFLMAKRISQRSITYQKNAQLAYFALKIRKEAMHDGRYPFSMFMLLKSIVAIITPVQIKMFFKYALCRRENQKKIDTIFWRWNHALYNRQHNER